MNRHNENLVRNYYQLTELIAKTKLSKVNNVTTDYLPPILVDKLREDGYRFDTHEDKIVIFWEP